jgi:hypothetical protein
MNKNCKECGQPLKKLKKHFAPTNVNFQMKNTTLRDLRAFQMMKTKRRFARFVDMNLTITKTLPGH